MTTRSVCLAVLLPTSITSVAQQRVRYTDEYMIRFRAYTATLGETEEAFEAKFPGGFRSTVKSDLRSKGELPTVFRQGRWQLLDPNTIKLSYGLGPRDRGEAGSFYFQNNKLVAAEVVPISDGLQTGDLTADAFNALRSLSAEKRSCAVEGSNSDSVDGSNSSQQVRIVCGQHYVQMQREVISSGDKAQVAYGLTDGIVAEVLRLVPFTND